jgi:hypothetical protein
MDIRAARSVGSCAEHQRADSLQVKLNDFNFVVSWWFKFEVECSEKKNVKKRCCIHWKDFDKSKQKSSVIVRHIIIISE